MFYTQNGMERPSRLSNHTRIFAKESLNRKYGKDTLRVMSVKLDDIEDFDRLTRVQKYDIAIKEIAEKAPLRICDGEKISGAATLGLSISHLVPATRNGKPVFESVSHLTIDFKTVLIHGVEYIEKQAIASYNKYQGTEKEPFAKSALSCIGALKIYHKRYLDALEKNDKYKQNYENLKRVPLKPATNFYEAVQSLWFVFSFVRLCGNWPGIGRIDYLLGDFLKGDLAKGKITLSEAREIIAHLFIKGCEWINGEYIGSGDAQHYQNIVICGIDENGEEVTNEVSYLILDVIEELGIGDFPTSVRINRNTSQALLDKVAKVISYGGGAIAIYNEDVVIDSLRSYGYDEKEAKSFANDGCWEVQIPGKTFFNYIPFDALQILQKDTLKSYKEQVDFGSFEMLYNGFVENLNIKIKEIFAQVENRLIKHNGEWIWKAQFPCTVVSLFEQGCIEKGLSYLEGGPIYNVLSPHLGGIADTANSLYAIKKLVYEEKRLTLCQLLRILESNWEDNEVLRQYVLNKYSYYGNDNDEVDNIARDILSDFANACDSYDKKTPYRFPAGVSSFGRQIAWAEARLATPYGRRKGEILSSNSSPTPGTDKEGVTAIIRSYCKTNPSVATCGSALDVKLLPSNLKGEDGQGVLVSLIKGFARLGGFFMQPDVVDVEELYRAQRTPENYQSLSVRVSGWNARFVTLDKKWQEMVIEQNE